MTAKNNQNTTLTKKEQSTTTAYKLMSQKINNLKSSLKKSQDESGRERQEKHELEKKLVLLENKIKNNNFLEILQFISSGGIGFSINYITAGSWGLGLSIGIPSIIIFIVCVSVNK
jgi:hypothetical protein